MEENVSPELSLAPEPEQSQDLMDNSPQATTEELKGQREKCQEEGDNGFPEKQLEDTEKSVKATSEIRKTWVFRRTTIAKRDMPGEAAAESQEGRGPVRRSGRQAKRTDKLEEFLLTTKRAGRRSGPASLEGGDPPPQTLTDVETASEASFDGSADVKSVDDKCESPEVRTRSGSRKKTIGKAKGGRGKKGGRGLVKDDASSENENDEDGRGDASNKPLSMNQGQVKDQDENQEQESEEKPSTGLAQEEVADTAEPQKSQEISKKAVEEESENKEKMKEEDEEDEEEEKESKQLTLTSGKRATSRSPGMATNKSSIPIKRDTKAKPGPKSRKVQEEDDDSDEDDSSTTSSSSSIDSEDDGGYDPNALYCICRQKHNKRFMICCDRCEEWFHGDCVGITEARGRLMERNGEDYVCPNCSAKKSQAAKAAVPVTTTENGKLKAAMVPGTCKEESSQSLSPGVTTPMSSSSTGTEEKGGDDMGIKGRIEKATNPSGKKKIKIFQPAAVQANAKASTEAAGRTGVKTEGSTLPKCIGPGCEKNAQPDSVYCGNDCILRHAAAAMKSITDVKEPKQKDKDKSKTQKDKPGTRSTPKKSSATGRRTSKKSTEEESDSKDEDEDEHAEDHPPPPATSSWSSDHNYNAVTPEKTTPISPTVLNKACPKEGEESDEEQSKKDPVPPEKKSIDPNTPPKGSKKSTGHKEAKMTSKGKKPSTPISSSKPSKKQSTSPSKTSKSKNPVPSTVSSPSAVSPGPVHITGALRVTKSTFTIPKKQPQPKDSPAPSYSSSSRVQSSSVSSAPSSQSQSSSARPSQPAASAPSMSSLPPPNNQMRQNIRRSLTDILYKRVSDSDDLNMSEGEVGKLAVTIEKEMFNLCLSTDSKYKNKYRSLMFNLKDPKNKGLFYRVVWGEVSPFRLVRLSAEELLSKEISEWRKPDISETPSARAQAGHSRSSQRHEASHPYVDTEDAPPMSDGDVCIPATSPSPRMASAAEQEESSSIPAGTSQGSAAVSGSAMPDIFSSMLKDTTSEHRAHLFDLNCKICTSQKTEDEPATKRAKLSKKPDVRPRQELRSSRSSSGEVAPAFYPSAEPPMPEPLPPQEDMHSSALPPQAPSLSIVPTVSSVSITRRDPRMARHSSGVTVTHTPLEFSMVAPISEELPVVAVPVATEVVPKGPLPMPPAPPPSIPKAALQKQATSASEAPPEGETALFLSSQEMIWKGFINMHTVAKFVTKAYLVSGSFEFLKEDLPDTIHIGGRISPATVWDYVGKLKTSLSKELCLIRFHPATEEEEVAYVSLFSYFSSRKRFGVVANNNRRIKDLYLIPLSSKDPLPAKLLPFNGPGLEPARPNLLLGLVICQKDRKRPGTSLEGEEKPSKIQTRGQDESGLPKLASLIKAEAKAEKAARFSQEVPFSTTPPGSPPPLSSSETSSSSLANSSVLSFLSSVKAPAVATPTGKDSPSSTCSAASATATPLQTILKTLFGKKKQDSEASLSPSDQGGEGSVPSATLLDPIVQQFGQISKEKHEEEDEDDRPYDPEEEYDPSMGYAASKKTVDTAKVKVVSKHSEGPFTEVDDVAYDPEDDTIFEEVKTVIPGQAKVTPDDGTSSLSNQHKMLEDLNIQIEEQKRQLEEQEESIRQQRSTTVTATACVPDSLIGQPTKSLLANSQLLQLGKKVDELVKSSVAPLINQRRDPRQSRDPRQAAASSRQSTDSVEKEEVLARVPETSSPPQLVVQQSETPLIEEEVTTEELPFLESDKPEVSIPLLGEQMEPDMEVNYIEDRKIKTDHMEPTKAESEMDRYSLWPNAASILKVGEISKYEQNSQESTSSSYFNVSTINTSTTTSKIPVLSQNMTHVSPALGDTHSPHLSRMASSSYHSDYRVSDTQSPNNFPPQLGPPPMQGPPRMLGPPPMSVPPPMQGLPPMPGPPPMQGLPPPIQVPIHGPPPMQGESSQSQYGPPPGGYPPYPNQWCGSQQAPPPGPLPQTIMPPRGPPLPFPPVGQRAHPPIYEPPMGSMPPQHTRQQGPPPGLPPPNFDGQNSLPPPRFSGPPPPFNYPGPGGPPPPFTGPPLGHFDSRVPPPSHFSGPRGAPPSQFGEQVSQTPMMDPLRGPIDQYNKDSAGSYKQGMDHHQAQYKDNQAPPPGPPYRGPPPNQYEGRKGPPPSAEMSGQRFQPHSQYRAPSPPPPPHRGSYDDLRGPPPQDNRGPPQQHFAGPQRYRLDSHPDDLRPGRHSGPLLPTPPEGPIPLPNRMGGHSPNSHRDEHWRRHSPGMRRRSSSTREGSEPRSGERPSRFEGVHRERESVPGSSRLSEERQRDLSEDRRRDREPGPHGGRPWDRSQGKHWSREREWDKGKERDRDRERSRERERSKGRDGERHRETDGDRHREPEPEKRRDRERDRDRERERGREREPDRREPERREPDRRDHDRDRGRIRDRDRDKERDRERERDKDIRDRRRERSRSRDRDRGKDRDRARERDRDKDRDRRDRSRSKEKREEKRDNKHDASKASEKSAEMENDKNTS